MSNQSSLGKMSSAVSQVTVSDKLRDYVALIKSRQTLLLVATRTSQAT